jgi:hypothetical protein
MSVIHPSTVEALYQRLQPELDHLIPIDQWAIKPVNWCWTTAKTKYGMADHQGIIHINRYFLETDFDHLLESVIRHEFAHLCVGLNQGHNKRFKNCEHLFKAQFDRKARQQANEYTRLVKYKYMLVAELFNGQSIKLKLTHRKHRKYTAYRYHKYQAYYYQQQAIKTFKYIEID